MSRMFKKIGRRLWICWSNTLGKNRNGFNNWRRMDSR